jgi:hypothetical protein
MATGESLTQRLDYKQEWGSVGMVDEQLNYKIEFKAKAAMPQNQSGGGIGSFEILINGKMRYKISYSIDNKTALEDFQKTIATTMEEISVIVKTTMGTVGHRVLVKTLRVNEQGLPNIEAIERELHVPKLINPSADDYPLIMKSHLDTEMLKRLKAAAPRMKEYAELLLELYALTTTLDFTEFKNGFDLILPRVEEAKKKALIYYEEGDQGWPQRILQEFPEYRYGGAYDLVFRLIDNPSLIHEKILLAIDATGATFSSSSHITLELIARVCGSNPYQYTIKHLEAVKAGKHPRSGKTRKRKHVDSITRSELITLTSELLSR